ncbi:MAG TPA: DUF2177 family protein [Candidatus Saccharimonadales bacterium]|jgi:uncharacterized membrane protein|nr:DUF2177 family protein [Candidatus Saccharimonadales bacterium]
MSKDIYTFLVTFGVMTILDALWLGLIAPKFYKKHIGFIMSKKPNWIAALIFYLVFVLGLTIFVVYPGWHSNYTLLRVGLLGGLFGLVCYSTYDLTNQATLNKWPFIVTIVDLCWGTLLSAAVSMISVALFNAFIK